MDLCASVKVASMHVYRKELIPENTVSHWIAIYILTYGLYVKIYIAIQCENVKSEMWKCNSQGYFLSSHIYIYSSYKLNSQRDESCFLEVK